MGSLRCPGVQRLQLLRACASSNTSCTATPALAPAASALAPATIAFPDVSSSTAVTPQADASAPEPHASIPLAGAAGTCALSVSAPGPLSADANVRGDAADGPPRLLRDWLLCRLGGV